jgi:hypothetical protein
MRIGIRRPPHVQRSPVGLWAVIAASRSMLGLPGRGDGSAGWCVRRASFKWAHVSALGACDVWRGACAAPHAPACFTVGNLLGQHRRLWGCAPPERRLLPVGRARLVGQAVPMDRPHLSESTTCITPARHSPRLSLLCCTAACRQLSASGRPRRSRPPARRDRHGQRGARGRRSATAALPPCSPHPPKGVHPGINSFSCQDPLDRFSRNCGQYFRRGVTPDSRLA